MYFFSVSYTVASFAITTVLAVLYGLIGTFSDQLLEIRVVETVIGGVVGGLAATLVLPIRTRGKVQEAQDAALEALEALLGNLAAPDRDGGTDLFAAARAVQEKVAEARTAAAPLTRRVPGLGYEQERARVRTLLAVGRYARGIAATTMRTAPHPHCDDAVARGLDHVCAHVRAARGDAGAADGRDPWPGDGDGGARGATAAILRDLHHLDAALEDLPSGARADA